MKKSIIILSIFSMLFLSSCVDNGTGKDPFAVEAEARSTKLDSTSEYFNKQYRTYTLEGCEYIVAGVGDMKWGSHKGNCKNPIHQKETSNGQN
jgi:outer membrane lipoprotein-sorting protein